MHSPTPVVNRQRFAPGGLATVQVGLGEPAAGRANGVYHSPAEVAVIEDLTALGDDLAVAARQVVLGHDRAGPGWLAFWQQATRGARMSLQA